mgnify:FL=1
MIFIFQKYKFLYYFNIFIKYINNDNFKKIHTKKKYIKDFFLVTKNKLNNMRTILKISIDTFLSHEQFYRFDLWK